LLHTRQQPVSQIVSWACEASAKARLCPVLHSPPCCGTPGSSDALSTPCTRAPLPLHPLVARRRPVGTRAFVDFYKTCRLGVSARVWLALGMTASMWPSPWLLAGALICAALSHAVTSQDGAAVIVAFTVVSFAAVFAVLGSIARWRRERMTLGHRPADMLIVFGLVAFAVVSILVDAVQVGVGPGEITDQRIVSGLENDVFKVLAFKCFALQGGSLSTCCAAASSTGLQIAILFSA
jgi:hypothetical protein